MSVKDSVKRMRIQTTYWEKIFAKKYPIYDKGLLLKTYEELLKFNNKESKQQVLNGLNS